MELCKLSCERIPSLLSQLGCGHWERLIPGLNSLEFQRNEVTQLPFQDGMVINKLRLFIHYYYILLLIIKLLIFIKL